MNVNKFREMYEYFNAGFSGKSQYNSKACNFTIIENAVIIEDNHLVATYQDSTKTDIVHVKVTDKITGKLMFNLPKSVCDVIEGEDFLRITYYLNPIENYIFSNYEIKK